MRSENLIGLGEGDGGGEQEQLPQNEYFLRPSVRMSSAICIDSEFGDRAFIHGGSGANVG